ncbi:unnamed protein product [Arctogadus glacialis]
MAAQTRAVQDLSRTLERREKDRKGLQRPARPPTRARSSRGLPGPPPEPGPPEAFPADPTRPRAFAVCGRATVELREERRIS